MEDNNSQVPPGGDELKKLEEELKSLENPTVLPAPQVIPALTDEPPAPPPPTSEGSKATKIMTMAIGLLVLSLVGVGAYFLGTGRGAVQSTPTPFVSPTPGPTANWETYVNKTFGYQINYPPTYKIFEDEIQNKGDLSSVQIDQDCFYGNGNRCLRTQIDVVTSNGSEIQPLEKYFYYQPGKEPKIILDSTTMLDGEEALNREAYDTNYYSGGDLDGVGVVRLTTLLVHSGRVYAIEFIETGADQEEIKSRKDWKNNELVDQILSTFKFLETTVSASPSASAPPTPTY